MVVDFAIYRTIRFSLPWLVAAFWLALFWRFVLDSPSWDEMGRMIGDRTFEDRFSEYEFFGGFILVFLSMILVDRWYQRRALRRALPAFMKLHWSKRRNRDGRFICVACRSIFMMPPADFSDEGWVECGDCGHRIARYGEMKPYLEESRDEVLRNLWRRRF